jgi:hypothetical protein
MPGRTEIGSYALAAIMSQSRATRLICAVASGATSFALRPVFVLQPDSSSNFLRGATLVRHRVPMLVGF